MRAIRLPYPLPTQAPGTAPWAKHASAQWEVMRGAGMLIDFPERKVSYAIFCFSKSDVPLYADELRRAVELQSAGQEPAQMEIRISS